MPNRRHLLSIADLNDGDLDYLVDRGAQYARGEVGGDRPLQGRVLGIYFRTTSTRTRTAFSAAALRLGAQIVTYGPHDLQENTGETVEDTARVLVAMLDGLVARTSGPQVELEVLAAQRRMSVINAMSASEHPTQALSDLTTVRCRLGAIADLQLLYVGEGNNTATALALAFTRYRGVGLHLHTPPGYGLPPDRLAAAQATAVRCGSTLCERHDMRALPAAVDVVYTTRWQTTGTSKTDPDWRRAFGPFHVDAELMNRYPSAVFMHDLPAHRGEDVTADVIDGPASIAFEQAAYKQHSAMAVLEWCLTGA